MYEIIIVMKLTISSEDRAFALVNLSSILVLGNNFS